MKGSIAALVPVAAILTFPVWLAPAPIVFKHFAATEVVQLLTLLILVALLAERALEIFVGTWRSPDAAQLELAARVAAQELASLQSSTDEAAVRQARAALDAARRAERQYRCTTRMIALWAALALGLLVSGVGLRALETLVDPALNGWSLRQAAAFRLVDVLLTGGVIAGGSEGIHRITTVFDNFMSATANRAKATA